MEVALDDSHCFSPEEFCDAIITLQERPNVVRVNVIEKNNPTDKPLYWLTENFAEFIFITGYL